MFRNSLRLAALSSRSTSNFACRNTKQVVNTTIQQQKRHFSGPPREYEGAEAVVRQYLPEDHQVVLGFIGMYFGIYGLYKLSTMGKKAPVEEPVVAAGESSGDDEVPSLFADKFEEWSKIPGNMEKWEASFPEWEEKMKDAAFAAQYEKQFS